MGFSGLFESFRMMDLIPLSALFIIIPTHIETFSLQRILFTLLLGGMWRAFITIEQYIGLTFEISILPHDNSWSSSIPRNTRNCQPVSLSPQVQRRSNQLRSPITSPLFVQTECLSHWTLSLDGPLQARYLRLVHCSTRCSIRPSRSRAAWSS